MNIFYLIGILNIIESVKQFILAIKGKNMKTDVIEVRADNVSELSKNINPISILISVCRVLWPVFGIFITGQRLLFSSLVLSFILYIITINGKDARTLRLANIFFSAFDLLLVFFIIYNHFFNQIN